LGFTLPRYRRHQLSDDCQFIGIESPTMSHLYGAHQGSPYRMDRRRRRRKGSSRLPSGSWRFGTMSIATMRSYFPSCFPNTAPDGLARRLLTTNQSGALELQSTAGELSRECHRVAALRTTWLRYKSRAGTCNATPGIFASKVCLPSGTPVADSADLDCKRSEGCRRSGSAQDEPSLEAGGKQPWYWRPFKSSRNCTMSCMEMRRGL